jgi:hypothetical protein
MAEERAPIAPCARGDLPIGRADFGHAAIAIIRLTHENWEMEAAIGALVMERLLGSALTPGF